MFSMTGYGKGEDKQDGIEMTVEIKTVNNRYLDISVKSPKILNAYEEVIRSAVRRKMFARATSRISPAKSTLP